MCPEDVTTPGRTFARNHWPRSLPPAPLLPTAPCCLHHPRIHCSDPLGPVHPGEPSSSSFCRTVLFLLKGPWELWAHLPSPQGPSLPGITSFPRIPPLCLSVFPWEICPIVESIFPGTSPGRTVFFTVPTGRQHLSDSLSTQERLCG